jgi:hypothetical protein
MKKETITRIKITASEGNILTDGIHYGTTFFLAKGENSLKYYEISLSEYEKILEEEIRKQEEAMNNDNI